MKANATIKGVETKAKQVKEVKPQTMEKKDEKTLLSKQTTGKKEEVKVPVKQLT